jgi:hypothetical protein
MFGSSIHCMNGRWQAAETPRGLVFSVPEGVSGEHAPFGDYGTRNREVATRTDAQHRSDAVSFHAALYFNPLPPHPAARRSG